MAVDVLKYMSKSDIERMWYEDEILAEIDQEAEIAYAVKRERITMVKNLILEGDSMEKISRITGFTIDEINALKGE